MRPLNETLHRFWFEAAPATRLALLRILIGSFAFVYVMLEYDDYLALVPTDPSLFEPVGVVFHGPIGLALFEWLLRGTLVAGLCFIVGFGHRITGLIFAGLLLWVMCYRESWSMIYHSENLVVLHVIVLALARSADALSVDALFRDWRGRTAGVVGRGDQQGWQYGWPVRLMCALTVSAYFLAAVAKLASAQGFGWISGENLRAQMAMDCMRKELLGAAPNAVSYALYDSLWLFTMLAIGTMVVEFLAPLALLNRRLGQLWAVTAFLFHWGILVVMHIKFHYHLTGMLYLSFFPIERILEWPRKLRGAFRGKLYARGTLPGPVEKQIHTG